ncbi:MAG TPA: hypothetical protein VHO03_16775 [Ignavibacteriales bacterium]|nr:hypothetical protein [Ignavibacteriales bacterium]
MNIKPTEGLKKAADRLLSSVYRYWKKFRKESGLISPGDVIWIDDEEHRTIVVMASFRERERLMKWIEEEEKIYQKKYEQF